MKIKIILLFCSQLLVGPLKAAVVFSGNSSGRTLQNLINNSINMDGQLDQSFGSNPTHVLGTTVVAESISNSGTPFDKINAIALQQDGKIVAVGSTTNGGNSPSYITVSRFNADGTLDFTFTGGNGTHSTIPGTLFIESFSGQDAPGTYDVALAVVIQPNGKIVVGGYTSDNQNDPYCFALLRCNSDGSLDSTFTGGNGTTSFIPGICYINKSISGATNILDQINSIALRSDGTIVAAGYTKPSSEGSYIALAQFVNPPTFASYQKSYTGVGAGLSC